MTEHIRLAKRVAEQLHCSRSTAEQYIEGGFVSVGGQVVEAPGARVRPDQDVAVAPDASPLALTPVTLLLHKPPGYEAGLGDGNGPQGSRTRGAPPAQQLLTAATRAADDASGIRLLQKHLARLQALMPLPTEASGLVVFTQDWRVERKLTEDAEVIEQEVMAEVAGDVSPEQLQRLGHGLSFNGRPLPPVKVSVSSRNDAQTRLRFALKGVRPGQVPFMCDSVGLRLLALKRIRIGRVALAQLPPGQWRYMLADERF